MQQIKFWDVENEETALGILLKNGDCLCCCCGSIFPADELGETWLIMEKYEEWRPMTRGTYTAEEG